MADSSFVAAAVGNPLFFSFAKNAPGVKVSVFKDVPAWCDVKMNDINLCTMPQEDTLLDRVVCKIYGNVASLRSTAFPGHSGETVSMTFDEAKRISSEDDSEYDTYNEYDETALAGSANIDMSQPPVVIYNTLAFDESYLVAAKGGFVRNWADSAFPDEIKAGTIFNVPVTLDVTEFDIPRMSGNDVTYDSVFKLDIKDQMAMMLTTKELFGENGHSLTEYMTVSEVMLEHASLTADEVEKVNEDSMAMSQIDAEMLRSEELVADLQSEDEAFDAAREAEAEAEAAPGTESSLGFGEGSDSDAQQRAEALDKLVSYDADAEKHAFEADKNALDGIFGNLFDTKKTVASKDEEREQKETEERQHNQNVMLADAKNEGYDTIAEAQQDSHTKADVPSMDEFEMDSDELFF